MQWRIKKKYHIFEHKTAGNILKERNTATSNICSLALREESNKTRM
jgi:hypothetical protein